MREKPFQDQFDNQEPETTNNLENRIDYDKRLIPIFNQIPETKIKSMARFYFKRTCDNPLEELLQGLWVAKVRDGDDSDLYNLFEIYKLGHLIENHNEYSERLKTIFNQIPEAKIKSMARFYLKRKCNNPLEELLESLWDAKLRDGNDEDLRELLRIYKFSHLIPSNSLVVSIDQSHSHTFFTANDKHFTSATSAEIENKRTENPYGEDCSCW